jgi:hypothetical protein
LFLAAASIGYGQWINYKVAGVPRLKDGNPNLAAPAPRMNGKPDLTGIWMSVPAKPREAEDIVPGIGILAVPGDDPAMIPKYFFSAMADYKPDEIVMSPAALQAWQGMRGVAGGGCDLPMSPPMSDVLPAPRRIVQTPSLIVTIAEGQLSRQIHLDGRPLPEDPQPAFAGYSVGKWEGDTLVVESAGFNTRTPIDGMGHPRTGKQRLTERIRRIDFGHLEVQVTITDPEYYSKPIQFTYRQVAIPDSDLMEYVCTENEKDAVHMVKP